MDYYFDAPGNKPFPGMVCIGVTDASSPISAACRGWLKGISPEEARHALVLAIARDLRKGLPVDGWKTMVLSTVVEFRKMSTEDDFFWEATKLRESIGAQFETMYYSAACHQGFKRGGRRAADCMCMARGRNRDPTDPQSPRFSACFRLASSRLGRRPRPESA